MGAHEYCDLSGPGCSASTAAFTETGKLAEESLFHVRIVKRKRATHLDNGQSLRRVRALMSCGLRLMGKMKHLRKETAHINHLIEEHSEKIDPEM